MLTVGDRAPDFTLPDQSGEPISLSAYRGSTVVLYFYPRASTSGCTVQACSVEDHLGEYEHAGAVVMGVSNDPVSKLARFADEAELSFPLLSDADNAVAEAYGARTQKNMYGTMRDVTARCTFIVDAVGVIRHVIPRVTPKTHDEEVLTALAGLAAGVS
jgi:peroxiredoxin Q/BCP